MEKLGTALTESIGAKETTDLAVTVADAGLDAVLSSGALDGIPIFGVATGLWRAGRGVQQHLFVNKIIRFLDGLSEADEQSRQRFTEKLRADGKMEQFGETILLILDRVDDTIKPRLVGRLMAAHVRGDIDYEPAMLVAAMVSRCYAGDLALLKSFRDGPQGERPSVAERLFAAGLLSQQGFDGGFFEDASSRGTIYAINQYGKLLLAHALRDDSPRGSRL